MSDEWQKVGATSASEPSPSGSVSSPSLVAEPGGGFVVAWREWREAMGLRDGFHVHDIYAKRFDGSAWVELAGSATGGGVSDSPGDSKHPSLALDRDGNPVVAWEDDSSGNFEIYLKRFNGTAWESIADSASNGGISNSRAHSRGPSVATSDGSVCVAWHEYEPGPPVDNEEEATGPPIQVVLRCAEY